MNNKITEAVTESQLIYIIPFCENDKDWNKKKKSKKTKRKRDKMREITNFNYMNAWELLMFSVLIKKQHNF